MLKGSHFPGVPIAPDSSLRFTAITPRSRFWETMNLRVWSEVSTELYYHEWRSQLSHCGTYSWLMVQVLCSIASGPFPSSCPLAPSLPLLTVLDSLFVRGLPSCSGSCFACVHRKKEVPADGHPSELAFNWWQVGRGAGLSGPSRWMIQTPWAEKCFTVTQGKV